MPLFTREWNKDSIASVEGLRPEIRESVEVDWMACSVRALVKKI